MKAITVQVVLGSIRAKVDRSISANFTTPELTPEERTYFFELQNMPVEMRITPIDEPAPQEYKVDKDLEQKSQGQRIRSVLFLLWKQNPEGMDDFETYYRNKTEKYIQYLKEKIEG